MSEYTDVLERARQEFGSPDLPLDRVVVRHEQRRRNRRVGTIAVALVIAAFAVGGVLRELNRSLEKMPANETITPDNVKDLKMAWRANLGGSTSGQNLKLIESPHTSHFPDPILFAPTATSDAIFATSLSGGVYAFPRSCASTGQVCPPLWVADAGGAIWYPPTVSDGMVFVVTGNGRIVAYPTQCEIDGRRCLPSWTGSVPGWSSSSPVVAGDLVYVADHFSAQLFAFRTHCATGGRACSPLWVANAGKSLSALPPGSVPANGQRDVTFEPLVADGSVYVIGSTHQLYAFDAATGAPQWIGLTRWPYTGGTEFNQPAAADGEVFVQAGTVLYAFDQGCGSAGSRCQPAWTGTTRDHLVMTAPIVTGGVVVVGTASNGGTGHVAAFPTNCRHDGGACEPLWIVKADGETTTLPPVVAGGRVFVTSAIRGFTDAFDLSCQRACGVVWRAAPLPGFAQLGLSQSPVVSGGLVFVGNGREIRAFDVNCGSGGATCVPLWTWVVPSGIASTPTIVDGALVVTTSSGDVDVFTINGTS